MERKTANRHVLLRVVKEWLRLKAAKTEQNFIFLIGTHSPNGIKKTLHSTNCYIASSVALFPPITWLLLPYVYIALSINISLIPSDQGVTLQTSVLESLTVALLTLWLIIYSSALLKRLLVSDSWHL